jgi:squalene-hopene/tetraprenyl-beta-curcumene cyclase
VPSIRLAVPPVDVTVLREAFDNARRALVAGRRAGRWEGRLSASALSTATAIVALTFHDRTSSRDRPHRVLIEEGLRWLATHQNADGGWGDTVSSPSNISTTVLGWAACGTAIDDAPVRRANRAAETWIERAVGRLDPPAIKAAIAGRYGKDRTFSAPILLVCALTGRFGADGWRLVPQLPFEIAAVPQQWFKWLRLPVVSYALPALIAIGQARHRHRPSRNPIARALRGLLTGRTLDVMLRIQPSSGGFLEAVPLTAFVAMSLAAAGRADHPTALAGVEFLSRSVLADGSWPIDTNLTTWITTLAIDALSTGSCSFSRAERDETREWLLGQQYRDVHPYTGAAPGGWAWTDLSGGVPDADDTAGALLALRHLGAADARVTDAARAGVRWLLALQNADGGIPTFCRGWTNLPFDRSGSDLTAHALRAWSAWRGECLEARLDVDGASDRAIAYLARAARPDGAWVPLWFGSQHAPAEENPTYGTSRVLVALADLMSRSDRVLPVAGLIAGGKRWLLAAQNGDGGWGGDQATPSSIEETGLAVTALMSQSHEPTVERAIDRGLAWLVEATDRGRSFPEAPIGLYFAKLWYSEELYPVVFTVSALAHRIERLSRRNTAGAESP